MSAANTNASSKRRATRLASRGRLHSAQSRRKGLVVGRRATLLCFARTVHSTGHREQASTNVPNNGLRRRTASQKGKEEPFCGGAPASPFIELPQQAPGWAGGPGRQQQAAAGSTWLVDEALFVQWKLCPFFGFQPLARSSSKAAIKIHHRDARPLKGPPYPLGSITVVLARDPPPEHT